MATHSSILARRIPWTEEPGRLQSMGSQRGQTRLSTEHTHKQFINNAASFWVHSKVNMFYICVCMSYIYVCVCLIHIYIYILFQILFPLKLLQSTEQSSLCYTVGPCWLSILNIPESTGQSQTPIYSSISSGRAS